MSKVDELIKLASLLESKAIDIHDFEKLKAEIVNRKDCSPGSVNLAADITGGAASRMVSLEWTKFAVGIILTIAILSMFILLAGRDSSPFANHPGVPNLNIHR